MSNRFPWVGRTKGDSRVICMETAKIYSCPGAAALALKIGRFQVEACCNILLKEVEGKHFQWYAQYRLETPHPVEAPEIKYVEVKRPDSQWQTIRNSRTTLHQYNSRVKFVVSNLLVIIDKNIYEGDFLSCKELIELIKELNPDFSMTPRSMAQHLHAHQKTYERVIKMEFGKKWSKNDHREVTAVKFSKKEEMESIDKWEDEQSYLMLGRGKQTPILRLEDNRIFGNITAAYHVTGIRPELIRWCCYGDVNSVHRQGKSWTFRFVKFTE